LFAAAKQQPERSFSTIVLVVRLLKRDPAASTAIASGGRKASYDEFPSAFDRSVVRDQADEMVLASASGYRVLACAG